MDGISFEDDQFLVPTPKGLGAYSLGSVHPSVRTYVVPWTAISQKCMDQKVQTKIRYGLSIMHVKQIFDIIQNGGLVAILDVDTLGAVT